MNWNETHGLIQRTDLLDLLHEQGITLDIDFDLFTGMDNGGVIAAS